MHCRFVACVSETRKPGLPKLAPSLDFSGPPLCCFEPSPTRVYQGLTLGTYEGQKQRQRKRSKPICPERMSFSCSLEQDEAHGAMEKVVLASTSGSCRTEIYLLGATLTSWVSDGAERIYLSPLAVFNSVKAIRGGIPLVFPQFGQPDPSMAQHGFARTSIWSWECGCASAEPGSGKVILRLSSSPQTMSVWNHAFELQYTVTLTERSLSCELVITNPASASQSFKCQSLLHTYVQLPSGDITKLRARGFQHQRFVDKLASNGTFDEVREEADVACEVDRIYLGDANKTFPDVELSEDGAVPFLVVKKSAERRKSDGQTLQSLPIDVVYWNAWIDKSKALPDLGEGAYKSYVCVEPGLVADVTEVEPGEAVAISTLLVTN